MADNYSRYFGSKPVSDWTPNGSFESGHDFINQISEQKGKIAGAEANYGTQQSVRDSARQAYEDAYKSQSAYGDLYNQAKMTEGVDDAKSQYQRSLDAVNATQSAMTTLPSSINAQSARTLTSAQKNAALGNQMAKYSDALQYWTNQNAQDNTAYGRAMDAAQNLAQSTMGQEQAKVAQSMTNYQAQMDALNQMYQDVLNERNIMRTIYGQMYEDEYRHMQQEIEAWAKNLEEEGNRYAQAQQNYRAQLQANADKYAADAGLRLQQYLAKQQEAKAAQLKQPGALNYISTTGNYATPQTGAGYVDPIVQYQTDKNGSKVKVNTFVAPDSVLVDQMYGKNSSSRGSNGGSGR